MRRAVIAAVVLFMVMEHNGCVSSEPEQRGALLPLVPQSSERYQCGPSTLASVLAYHGKPLPEETISKAIYSPTARGTLLSDMAWYARTNGFQAEVRVGGMDDLKQVVENKQPPIVLLDLGLGSYHKPHFTAVTGMTPKRVYHLGTRRADAYDSMEVFTYRWKRAGNQYLVIMPSAAPSR